MLALTEGVEENWVCDMLRDGDSGTPTLERSSSQAHRLTTKAPKKGTSISLKEKILSCVTEVTLTLTETVSSYGTVRAP